MDDVDDDVALATARSVDSLDFILSSHMPDPWFICSIIVDAEPPWTPQLFA